MSSKVCAACERANLITQVVRALPWNGRLVHSADRHETGRAADEDIVWDGKRLRDYTGLELGGIILHLREQAG